MRSSQSAAAVATFLMLTGSLLTLTACGGPAVEGEYYSPPVEPYEHEGFTITLPELWELRVEAGWRFVPPSIEATARQGRAMVVVEFNPEKDEIMVEARGEEAFHQLCLDLLAASEETDVGEVDQQARGTVAGLPVSEMRVRVDSGDRDRYYFFRHVRVTGGLWRVAASAYADYWPALERELLEIVRSFRVANPEADPYRYVNPRDTTKQ